MHSQLQQFLSGQFGLVSDYECGATGAGWQRPHGPRRVDAGRHGCQRAARGDLRQQQPPQRVCAARRARQPPVRRVGLQ